LARHAQDLLLARFLGLLIGLVGNLLDCDIPLMKIHRHSLARSVYSARDASLLIGLGEPGNPDRRFLVRVGAGLLSAWSIWRQFHTALCGVMRIYANQGHPFATTELDVGVLGWLKPHRHTRRHILSQFPSRSTASDWEFENNHPPSRFHKPFFELPTR
jgi:hypothetical protein